VQAQVTKNPNPGSTQGYGREPESCLRQVFNYKLGCFCYE